MASESPSGPGAIGEAVARTVRQSRTAHGWSLDQLAARSGVSKGVLVALEQGRGNPNLGTLIRISEALGVALTRLVQVEAEPVVRTFPPERHVDLWHGSAGGVGTLLGGSDPRPSIELWRWEIRPGPFQTVVSQPLRFSTPSVSARLARSHASCTASSASLSDPSIR